MHQCDILLIRLGQAGDEVQFTIECSICGTVFSCSRSSKRPSPRFCSLRCKGIAMQRTQTGPSHHHWKGGRNVDANGYVRVWVDGKYVYEHRLVAESTLGRSLTPSEVVHHRNGNRSDNTPDNLEVYEKNGLHSSFELAREWAIGQRKHPPHLNEHLRLGAMLQCPICGVAHYVKKSRAGRPFAAYCPQHCYRGINKTPRKLAASSVSVST